MYWEKGALVIDSHQRILFTKKKSLTHPYNSPPQKNYSGHTTLKRWEKTVIKLIKLGHLKRLFKAHQSFKTAPYHIFYHFDLPLNKHDYSDTSTTIF